MRCIRWRGEADAAMYQGLEAVAMYQGLEAHLEQEALWPFLAKLPHSLLGKNVLPSFFFVLPLFIVNFEVQVRGRCHAIRGAKGLRSKR